MESADNDLDEPVQDPFSVATDLTELIAANENQLTGYLMMSQAANGALSIPTPWPPSVLSDDALSALKDRLSLCMPVNIISDLRDWDIQIEDELSEDWYFNAVFGDKDSMDDCAEELAEFFFEKCNEYDMDYDQFNEPEWFEHLVRESASDFIFFWRNEVLLKYGPGRTLSEIFGGGKIQSFPGGFDEETYRQAKPHFEDALAKFQAAGKTLKELFTYLMQQFGMGIRPYLKQFALDLKLSANLSVPATPSIKLGEWVRANQQHCRYLRQSERTAPMLSAKRLRMIDLVNQMPLNLAAKALLPRDQRDPLRLYSLQLISLALEQADPNFRPGPEFVEARLVRMDRWDPRVAMAFLTGEDEGTVTVTEWDLEGMNQLEAGMYLLQSLVDQMIETAP